MSSKILDTDFCFSGRGHELMVVNGLRCTLNLPPAIHQRFRPNGEEIEQRLPPYAPRAAFSVDEYAACPSSWMRGSPKETSCFVPVKPEHGLWLDFNDNFKHRHHVAIRISIQGVCAITGLPTKERVNLEQYRERCPVHNTPFGSNRFCPECKFSWPAQNYLASTGAPQGLLWLDGFRASDGCTRQFVFTEKEERGVAAQIIGADRVFAIGIAFYLSKKPKPEPVYQPVCRRVTHKMGFIGAMSAGSVKVHHLAGQSHPDDIEEQAYAAATSMTLGAAHNEDDGVLHLNSLTLEEPDGSEECCLVEEVIADEAEHQSLRTSQRRLPLSRPTPVTPKKRLEIAAGARIAQEIHPDPNDLDFWQDEPAGTIYINYTDEETAREILAAEPDKSRSVRSDGFLARLRFGHPKMLPGD